MGLRTVIYLMLGSAIWLPRLAQSAQDKGAVLGVVVDLGGKPVSGATVVAWPPDRAGPTLFTGPRTDGQGKFTMENLSPGLYWVVAIKENEGYPDATSTFYSPPAKVTELTVQAGRVAKGVVVRVGPKAGRLIGRIADGVTGQPPPRAMIVFYEAESPQDYMGTGPDVHGRFSILVPSMKAFRMRVSAPGYATWYYGADGTEERVQPLRLASGEGKELTIRLKPIKQPR